MVGWLFHAGGRDGLEQANSWAGRAVGGVLYGVGMLSYVATAGLLGLSGYLGWHQWRIHRAEASRARQECARQADARNANDFIIDATGRHSIGTPAKRQGYFDTCVAASKNRGNDD